MQDDRDTPTSPQLILREEEVMDYGAGGKGSGNGGGTKKTKKLPSGMSAEQYAEAAYEAAERAAQTALESIGHIGQLAAEVGGLSKDVQDLKHIVVTGKVPPPRQTIPPPRPPAPSFSNLSVDDGDEIVTMNGTKKVAYSEEQLREKMRREWTSMQEHASLVKDAEAVRAMKTRGRATVWAIITAGIVGGFSLLIGLIKHWVDSALGK
jgi:hypothetical protein